MILKVIWIIIEILLIISIVFTAFQEPKLTFEYSKAVAKSGITFIKWCVGRLDDFNNNNEITDNNVQQN